MIRNAAFVQPEACIHDINYTSGRKLNRGLIERLATCEYITEHRNIFISGATGSNKTYMACAFGMEACKQRYKTKYIRLPDLLMELEMARNDGTYKKVQAKYANPVLLIMDEWLLLKPTETEQHDILELLHRRLRKSSTIFCSQYDSSGWYDQLGGMTVRLLKRFSTASNMMLTRSISSQRIRLTLLYERGIWIGTGLSIFICYDVSRIVCWRNHMRIKTELELRSFYPSALEVANICQTDAEIHIKMFARSKNCTCPKCGIISAHRHGTYERKLQDLPILGKFTWLFVNSYEYQCDNPDCNITTFVETVNGFLSYYSWMTDCGADFICALAMETSYKGCSRICRAMNLKISGDNVIRLLTKRFKLQEEIKCGSTIGVDDSAFKKRHTYGTIIVDETTHTPVTT